MAAAQAPAFSPEALDANFPTGRPTMEVPLQRATAGHEMWAVVEEAFPAGQRLRRPSAEEEIWEQDETSDDP